MRYYEIPDRPVISTDPEDFGKIRPTRVSRFSGGPESTRFTDPETGEVFRAIRVDDRWTPIRDPEAGYWDRPIGWTVTPSWISGAMDFRFPVDPGMKYRIRKNGSVRPIGWKPGLTPSAIRV